MAHKLPAHLRNYQGGFDISHLTVFTHSLITASKVAARVPYIPLAVVDAQLYGYCLVDGVRVYWCRYGYADDPSIYAKEVPA